MELFEFLDKQEHNYNIWNKHSRTGYINEINDGRIIYEIFPNLYNFLTEEHHITHVFDDVIKDIKQIYDEADDNVILYTNWNFNINTQECMNLCTEDIDVPIYIEILNLNSKEFSAIYDKDELPNKIIILLNRHRIGDNDNLLYACCRHEFLHAREMYAKSGINILKSNKNRIPENEENIFSELPESQFNDILYICYLFSESEERARINAVDKYIDSLDDNYFNLDDIRSNNLESTLIKETNELSRLEEMYKIIDLLEMRFNQQYVNYTYFEALNYYCYKYRLTKQRLYMYHFSENLKKEDYPEKTLSIMKNVINDLKNNRDKYRRNIFNTIYYNFRKKKVNDHETN